MTRLERGTHAIILALIFVPTGIVIWHATATLPDHAAQPLIAEILAFYLFTSGTMIANAVVALALYWALPRTLGGRYRIWGCGAVLIFFLSRGIYHVAYTFDPVATFTAMYVSHDTLTRWQQTYGIILTASHWLSILAGAAFLVLCAVSLGVRVTRRLRRGGARG